MTHSGQSVARAGSHLKVDAPETLAFAGVKTIAVLSHLLADETWHYIWLGNTSTFVNVDRLIGLLPLLPNSGVYAGTSTRYGRHTFASGTGLVLSRDVAEATVHSRRRWRHDLLVDVALGKMCQSLGVMLTHLERLDLSSVSQLDEMPDEELVQHLSIRCKSHQRPSGEVELMTRLHRRLVSIRHLGRGLSSGVDGDSQ